MTVLKMETVDWLFSSIFLLLISCSWMNAQYTRYDGHYYAFYHYQPNKARIQDAIEVCNETDAGAYPLVLNSAAEQAALHEFFVENSYPDDLFVWLGQRSRSSSEKQTCAMDANKPADYDCDDPKLMLLLDGSYSTYTAWASGTTHSTAVVWSRVSNEWRGDWASNDDRVKQFICEHHAPCSSSNAACVPNGACLQRTEHTEYGCACDDGFTGNDCTQIVTEPPGEETTDPPGGAAAVAEALGLGGSSNAGVAVIVGVSVAVVLAVGVVAYVVWRKKRKTNTNAVRRPSLAPSQVSQVSQASMGSQMSVGSAMSAASAGPGAMPM